MFFFGRSYSRRTELRELRRFRCAECSHERHAWVVGLGSGQGASPYLLFDHEARARANAEAARTAAANVERTLSLATCPGCGKVSRKAWIDVRMPALLGIAVVALVVARLDWWYVESDPNVAGVIFFSVVGLFACFAIWRSLSWQWRTVSERVEFVDDEEVSRIEEEIASEEDARDARRRSREERASTRKRRARR